MKRIILITLMIIPILCNAYIWESIGPSDITANNFYVCDTGIIWEIICTSNGILINNDGIWEEYNYSYLPVWDVHYVTLATGDLLVVMGNGSYSDGIYLFNFINFEFFVVEWFFNPRFIEYCETDGYFYVGGEQGLAKSETGTIWEAIEFFNGKYCHDMVYCGSNYVVSTNEGSYYSDNAGMNWFQSGFPPSIRDLEFNDIEILYGIFPGPSLSSGLWSSTDYGADWEMEFWSPAMSSVGIDCEDNIFVGWEIWAYGVAIWSPDTQELTFMNNGLPDLNVNKLTSHPFIDCANMVCCTDNGVYVITDYITGTEENEIPEAIAELSNYPNPFNPTTTISFSISRKDAKNAEIVIYNIKGQKVKQLLSSSAGQLSAGKHSVTWNGKDENNKPVASGIYFYNLKVGNKSLATKKCLLLK